MPDCRTCYEFDCCGCPELSPAEAAALAAAEDEAEALAEALPEPPEL